MRPASIQPSTALLNFTSVRVLQYATPRWPPVVPVFVKAQHLRRYTLRQRGGLDSTFVKAVQLKATISARQIAVAWHSLVTA